jgi:hypothetical protein
MVPSTNVGLKIMVLVDWVLIIVLLYVMVTPSVAICVNVSARRVDVIGMFVIVDVAMLVEVTVGIITVSSVPSAIFVELSVYVIIPFLSVVGTKITVSVEPLITELVYVIVGTLVYVVVIDEIVVLVGNETLIILDVYVTTLVELSVG